MATIRQRPASKKDPSPPLYSVAKLSADVRQIKQSAIEKEVTLKELKDQLKIPSKAKKISANNSSTSPLWSKLLLCYRVMVLLSLTYVVFYLFIMYSPSITSLLLKVFCLCVYVCSVIDYSPAVHSYEALLYHSSLANGHSYCVPAAAQYIWFRPYEY